MVEDRTDLMIEILRKLQSEIGLMRREQASLATRMLAMEDHQRGILTSLQGVVTSIHGVEGDIAHLKERVDRIETRMGLKDTEH